MPGPIRVLVADDHAIVREGLARVLDQEEGLEVVGQAGDGAEAVALAKELGPDVVLMDLQMPGVDGVEAIQQLKEQAPDIGVIILTTFDTDEYIFRGIEAGARAYLLKDATPQEVVRAIERVHGGQAVIEPRVAKRLVERFAALSKGSSQSNLLSPREIEVATLMARGASNKEIASQLVIGEATVKTHIIHIFNKLEVKGRAEAVAAAVKKKIIQL